MDIIIKYFYVILVFIFVMAILLFTTKYLAYKSKKLLQGNYMHIVESLSLGVNNRLHLIKVDKEFFIISATGKSIEFLARVNIDDYQEEEIKNPISEVIDFKSVLKKYIGTFNSRNHPTAEANPVYERPSGQNQENVKETQGADLTFRKNLEKLRHLNKSINGQRSKNEQEK